MKKHKIMGIGLVLALLVSLVAMAVPTAAAPPGDGNFVKQSSPGPAAHVISNGADVGDFEIAQSSGRVYLLDTGKALLKSGTSGTVWGSRNKPAGATLSFVAVAPDDDQSIAVVDQTTGIVWISPDGGNAIWNPLPAIPGPGMITDVDISPARSNSLYGREYVVSLANPAAGSTTGGDVKIIGSTSNWVSAAGALLNAADFMVAQFSQGYLGDRVVVAGGVTAGGTANVYVVNTNTMALAYSAKKLFDGGADYGAAGGIMSMDIAMPSDFDPMSTATLRCWVSTGHAGGNAGDDVYRVSGAPTGKDLNAVNDGQAIDSVAYAGTNADGKLFVGYTSSVCMVKSTTEANSNVPTWASSRNSPTGNGAIIVRAANDFASSDKVFAATTGAQSAWSISDNGGTSFYQRSAIDNTNASNWGVIESMVPVPDGSGFWMLTDSGNDLEVWLQTSPPSSMSAKRYEVLSGAGNGAAGDAELLLNPDWAAAPSIYVHDMVTGKLHHSSNGGDTWSTRYVPTGADKVVVVDSNTLYAFIGDDFQKTTNNGWIWEDPVDFGSGTATDVVVADDGTIFIATDGGAVAKSTNGGASFSNAVTYGAMGEAALLVVDPGYDTNGYLYLASMDSGYVVRSDPATNTWRSFGYTGAAAVGFTMVDGVLYLADEDGIVYANNLKLSGWWKEAADGSPGDADAFVAVSDNSVTLYLIDGKDIYGYIDYISSAKTTVEAPSMVDVDPTNGRAAPFQLSWKVIGTGLGESNRYDINVRDAATKQSLGTTEDVTGTSRQISSGSPAVLEAGKTYEFRVRANRQKSGDTLESLWSDWVTVKVASGAAVEQPYASPQVLGPVGGATTSQNPGFAWGPVTGATEYTFWLATDAAGTKTVAGTPVTLSTTSFQATGLDYGTTYFWGVMVTKPNPGPQTISTFTVMDEPAPPAPAPTTTVEVPPQPTPTVIVEAPAPAPAPEPAIPAVAIWVVIGVGAVLIIVIIVLIVRTRRPV